MLKKLKNSKGFTIIEVMIVLAIAGMIILVVLLAVPAVQRNGRNTAIKNDASSLAGGIAEFASNNDGALPTTGASSCAAGAVTFDKTAGTTTPSKPKVQGSTVVSCISSAAAYTVAAGTIAVDFGYKCPDPVPAGTTVTPVVSARATAIMYATEASGGLQARCLDS